MAEANHMGFLENHKIYNALIFDFAANVFANHRKVATAKNAVL